ncbi:MAG TPA: hypothetical protein VGY97_13680 [Solirubrobacteraceae bacterium]|jgi:hypothetical protein|nr:hypothetical protein [Solirubrobacteraceae bacterium]
MTTFEELDQLPTEELHRRAVRAAERRLDIRFFWKLFKMIPEAEAISGNVGEGQEDVARSSIWLYDFVSRGGKLDEALRPVYIDYLLRHEKGDDATG